MHRLHENGFETLIEDLKKLKEHKGIFGVEKDDWSAYMEHQSVKRELEESPANREAPEFTKKTYGRAYKRAGFGH